MLSLVAKQLFICLIITIVIEYIPIVIFLQIPKKYFFLVNVLSNVVANIVILIYDISGAKSFLPINRWQVIIIIEVLVCIVEIFLYYIYAKKKSIINNEMKIKIIATTIFANLISLIIGSKLIS